MQDLYHVVWANEGEVRGNQRYFFDNRSRAGSAQIYCVQRTRAGRVFFDWRGKRHFIQPAHAMIFSHHEESAYGYPPQDTQDYVGDFVSLEGPDVPAVLEAVREGFGGVVPMPSGTESARLFSECVRRFKKRAFRNRFQESAMVYELLMSLLSEARQSKQTRDPVLTAHELILSRFGTPITVGEIAEFCNLSREHLSRAYAARYAASPAQTLRELRMENARELLAHTRANIWQIAERCGYRDADNFTRAFLKKTGCNPLEYRGKSSRAK